MLNAMSTDQLNAVAADFRIACLISVPMDPADPQVIDTIDAIKAQHANMDCTDLMELIAKFNTDSFNEFVHTHGALQQD